MDSNNGRLYHSIDAAILAGAKDPVEITGTPEAVQRISEAVADYARAEIKSKKNKKNKAAKKARRINR